MTTPLAASSGPSFGPKKRRGRPTAHHAIDVRILLPLGAGLAVAVVGLLFLSGEVVGLSVPLILFACIQLVSAALLPEPRLSIRRTLEKTKSVEGEEISVTLEIVNRGTRLRQVHVVDRIPEGLSLVDGEDGYLGPLESRESKMLTYTVHLTRGEHLFPGVAASVWSSWGLGHRKVEVEHASCLVARPRTETLEPITIRPARTRAFAGPVKSNLGGRGLDFFGCRAFTPGDDIRRINWRAFARQDSLIINEYELERIADVNVILDARARSHTEVDGESTFDHAVRATGSIASHFVDQGNNVGLLIYGDYLNWVFPSMGKSQKERILEKLTHAHVSDKAVFEELRDIPARLFPAKSQIVLVSPLVGVEDIEVISLLVDRGYSVIVVCPSALSLERSVLDDDLTTQTAERIAKLKHSLFMETLSSIGARAVDWNVTIPLSQAIAHIHRPGMRRHR